LKLNRLPETLGPAALSGAAFLYDPAAIAGLEKLVARSDIPLWGCGDNR
jgi:hypothetical protein